MSRARRIADLKPFLPGLETLLEDPEVSELMINGPCNVWVEREGRLHSHPAPRLTEHVLDRAAIQIARPLELDPRETSIIDARLEDGSRVAISVPPASPKTAITVRRFGNRSFSAGDLVRRGSLPAAVLEKARELLRARRNILVSGGTGSGKTTLLNALIELLPQDERIVSIEDTLELKITRPNSLRFEAGQLKAHNGKARLTIRDLVRHALRHRPDHIVVGEVRGGEAADLLQALNTGHGGLPTICQEVETRFVWPSVTGIHPCRKPREPVREPRPPHRPQAAGCALERRLRQRQPGRGPGRSRCRHAAWHRRRSGADRPPNAGRAHDRGRGRVAPDTCCG